MTDNYEFMRSSESQNIDEYTPYTNKQFNFVNDTNSSVYSSAGLSLVQFDLSSIYNSQTFVDTNDMFLVIPLVTVAAFGTAALGGATVAPVAGNFALTSLKSSYLNLIHQCDLSIDGKTIESTQPYQNIPCNFRMMSEMSIGDQKTMGPTFGFSEVLDSPNSCLFNNLGPASNAVPYRGNGFTNNLPFSSIAAGFGSSSQGTIGPQNKNCINEATQRRLGRTVDLSATGTALAAELKNNFAAIIGTGNQSGTELRPYYTTSGNYMIWYDTAVIKLSSIMDSFAEVGLCKKFNGNLRIWLNTGSLNVAVGGAGVIDTVQYTITNTNSTFTNTCPLMINHLNNAPGLGGLPTTTTNIVAGLFIGTATQTTVGPSGISLSASGASHALRSCRIYYSQVSISLPKAISYITENRSKTVRFRNMVMQPYYNIAAGSTINQLVSSGIVNPLGILIVPFISPSSNGIALTSTNLTQYGSPFDSAPLTTAPISLTNLQVAIGGQNQLNDTLFYGFQHFVEQVSLAENLTSADWGISCGLFSQQWWETFRYYYINVSRSDGADKKTPRNVNLSFINNSAVIIEVMVFVIFADSFVIDVETGNVTR